jgi:hypothetical protein
MQTSGTPSSRQYRSNICPSVDAAAVCTSAVWPSARIVSTIPSTVIGFTKDAAPAAAGAPAGSARHAAASTQRYCAYIAPP